MQLSTSDELTESAVFEDHITKWSPVVSDTTTPITTDEGTTELWNTAVASIAEQTTTQARLENVLIMQETGVRTAERQTTETTETTETELETATTPTTETPSETSTETSTETTPFCTGNINIRSK